MTDGTHEDEQIAQPGGFVKASQLLENRRVMKHVTGLTGALLKKAKLLSM